ncbi:MAG: carbohydrate binding domain-containing protein [Blastocatellia bacterium]
MKRLIFLSGLAVLLGWLSWLCVRTAIGDSLVTYARRAVEADQGTRLQAVQAAADYVSDDPSVRFQSGLVYLDAFNNGADERNLANAIQELRAAAQINPEDYRIWLALSQALERSTESSLQAEAQRSLEQAVRLAPRHFEPHWTLGNFLLRAGKREPACAAFRAAVTSRPEAFPLIFDSLWEAWQGDLPALIHALDLPPAARSQMAVALAHRRQLTQALAVWQESDQTQDISRLMTSTLLDGGFYSAAFEVWRKTPGLSLPVLDNGSLLSNGGFDQEIALGSKAPFLTWQINPYEGVNAVLDEQQPHSGRYSLRIGFGTKDSGEFEFARQNVPVSPATSYRVSFVVRSQELKSFSPPLIEVTDMAGAEKLGSAAPTESDIREWRESAIDFTTKPNTEAVAVRIFRRACPESPCPLTGRFWIDSVRLIKALPKNNLIIWLHAVQ